MLIALGSLGLPVGTEGMKEAFKYAHEHPHTFWIAPAIFYVVLFGGALLVGHLQDRRAH